jgi:HEAT repeat protein
VLLSFRPYQKDKRRNIYAHLVHRTHIDNRFLSSISETLVKSLAEMEKHYDDNNKEYFKNLLNHPSHIIRTRAVCILADIAGEDSIESLSQVLEHDANALVIHEAAFSLGQLGFKSGIIPLIHAVEFDPSFFVRHEAAIALGVIGSAKARATLIEALGDANEEVRESALVALANLEYISTMRRKNKFTKMTGG